MGGSRSLFVYIIFQASSGREMDQNKGLRPVLYSNVFGHDLTTEHILNPKCPASAFAMQKGQRKIEPLVLFFSGLNWQWAVRVAAEAVLLNLLEEIISTSQTSIITLLLRHPTSKLNRSHWSQKSNRQLEIRMSLIQTTFSFDWRDSRIFMRWKIYICCQIVTLCLPFVFKRKF